MLCANWEKGLGIQKTRHARDLGPNWKLLDLRQRGYLIAPGPVFCDCDKRTICSASSW
jgi:hypothetical protein